MRDQPLAAIIHRIADNRIPELRQETENFKNVNFLPSILVYIFNWIKVSINVFESANSSFLPLKFFKNFRIIEYNE